MRGSTVPTKQAKPPTVRLRRLATELRRLRTAAQLSREHVEERTGVNEGTLYRIETARARPQKRTLMALLDLYGADDALRADLLAISRGSDDQGWMRPYHVGLPETYTAYIGFEDQARSVRNYQSLFIPGLLQTEEYARSVITGTLPKATRAEVDQRVQARMERQHLLDRENPLELWTVIDEAALHRGVGGQAVMAWQAGHLRDMGRRPNVTVQVIPFEAGAHPGMPGSFSHLDFPDPLDPELVYIDTLAGELFLESDDDMRLYRSMFDHLRAMALSPAETSRMLTDLAASLEDPEGG
jgi:transcriptional regulator with XRE-family HTH domain